jgi:hypothetical protein
MTAPNSPRGIGRGKPEGELRPERRVPVRSLDAKRHLGNVSEEEADELILRSLCTEKRAASGRRLYLRLLRPYDELPLLGSIKSLITVRHVQGPQTVRAERGVQLLRTPLPGFCSDHGSNAPQGRWWCQQPKKGFVRERSDGWAPSSNSSMRPGLRCRPVSGHRKQEDREVGSAYWSRERVVQFQRDRSRTRREP